MRRSEIVIIRYRRVSTLERFSQQASADVDCATTDHEADSRAGTESKLNRLPDERYAYWPALINKIFHRWF